MLTLTPSQLEEYHDQGYVVVPDVFPADELDAVDREIDQILEEQASTKDTEPHRILQLGLRSEITRQFCKDERILNLIQDIVQPGIAIYSAKIVAKPPNAQDLVCPWHQDDAYYNPTSLSKTRMSVWIPLQDTGERNGGIWFLPGSHRRGMQEHSHRSGQCPLSFEPTEADLEKAVPCAIRAGSAALFSAMTWHHSKGNFTDCPRRSFIISYQEATVPRGNGRQWTILRPAV